MLRAEMRYHDYLESSVGTITNSTLNPMLLCRVSASILRLVFCASLLPSTHNHTQPHTHTHESTQTHTQTHTPHTHTQTTHTNTHKHTQTHTHTHTHNTHKHTNTQTHTGAHTNIQIPANSALKALILQKQTPHQRDASRSESLN